MDPRAVPGPLAAALLEAGYRLGGPAGVGGGGPVWTAVPTGPTGSAGAAGAERVVVQVLTVPDGEAGARLAARLEALWALAHPHLPEVVDVVAVPSPDGAGELWAVLLAEVPGATVAALLAARGRLSAGEVVTLTVPVAGALDALHRADLVHGDVSPANLVVRPDGRPVLIDVLTGAGGGDGGGGPRGTPGFTAPEVGAVGLAPGTVGGVAGGHRAGAGPAHGDRAGAGPADDAVGAGRAGGALPAGAPADVFALAGVALAALDLAAHEGRLGEELRAACATDPVRRPTAAELAAALYACAEPEPIGRPDAGVLARTALAQLAAPDRTVSVPTGARHRAGRGSAGRAVTGRVRGALVAAGAVVALGVGVWGAAGWGAEVWGPGTRGGGAADAGGEHLAGPARPTVGSTPPAPTVSPPPAPTASPAPAPSAVPAPSPPAGGIAPPTASAATSAPPTPAPAGDAPAPATAVDAPSSGSGRPDPVDAAAALTRQRAAVLASGDTERLAEVLVPDSPAHRADRALMDRLAAAGVTLDGLTAVVEEVALVAPAPGEAAQVAARGPTSVDVRVRSGLTAHARRSPSGTTEVPAQPVRPVVLRLGWTDDGWRVAEVRPE